MRKPPSWQRRAVRFLEESTPRVFTKLQFEKFVQTERDKMDVPRTLTTKRVVDHLVQSGVVRRVEVRPEGNGVSKLGRPYSLKQRYLVGEVSPYSVALSLRSNSYFTHLSAMHLLNLTLENPKTIYVNREQSEKPSSGIMTQAAIDRAFAGKPRESKYVYTFDHFRIMLLSGKQTGRLEVTELQQDNSEFYPTTKVERTLIDGVVRPSYSGGIFHVRDVFRTARDRVSINVLLVTLRKLGYAYPYHQAIGFLMERTGYPPMQLERFKSLGLNYDFYLSHQLKNPSYDASWRIYYPSDF